MTKTTLPVTLEDYKRIEYNCEGMVPGERDYMIQLWIDYVAVLRQSKSNQVFNPSLINEILESIQYSFSAFLSLDYTVSMLNEFRSGWFVERDRPQTHRELGGSKDSIAKWFNRPLGDLAQTTAYFPQG